MDLDKTSLIKTILQKLRDYLKSQPSDKLLNEFSEIFKKCQYLKLRKLSNELFYQIDYSKGNVNELIEEFRLKILECCTNETLKNHISENSNEKNENICLSSDDEFESQKSMSSLFSNDDPLSDSIKNPKDLYIDSDDSDIEIIDAKESIKGENGGSHYNMRKRKVSNSKENINLADGERIFKQSRYEFRERRPQPCSPSRNTEDVKPNVPPSQHNNKTNEKPGKNIPRDEEVIQIEDSSSDEDVQEIRCESSSSYGQSQRAGFNSFRNTNSRLPRNPRKPPSFKVPMSNATDHPPTQADPSQLASIPFIVQFPTMQASTFNGHLYISHNHKFSVKLQGIDPRNFRWN